MMDERSERERAAEDALAATAPLRSLTDEVRSYPLRLLRLVAEQHAARKAPVPDHALRLPPYLGETALRGLLEGGFIARADGARGAIHAYAPTEAGLALIASLNDGNGNGGNGNGGNGNDGDGNDGDGNDGDGNDGDGNDGDGGGAPAKKPRKPRGGKQTS